MSIKEKVIDIVNDVLGVEASEEDTFEELYSESRYLVEMII